MEVQFPNVMKFSDLIIDTNGKRRDEVAQREPQVAVRTAARRLRLLPSHSNDTHDGWTETPL